MFWQSFEKISEKHFIENAEKKNFDSSKIIAAEKKHEKAFSRAGYAALRLHLRRVSLPNRNFKRRIRR